MEDVRSNNHVVALGLESLRGGVLFDVQFLEVEIGRIGRKLPASRLEEAGGDFDVRSCGVGRLLHCDER